MAAVGVLALIGSIVVPLSTQAGPADSYFILGEWTYEGENDWFGDYTSTLNFKLGGSGESTWETDTTTTTTKFDWKIEDGEIFIKDPDDDDWGTGSEYEFSGFYTKLTVGEGSDEEYKKTASVCGVCCPFPFMLIGFPAMIGLVAVRAYKKRN